MNDLPTVRRLGVGLLSVAMLLAACSSAATPSGVPSAAPPSSAPPDAPVSAPPDASADPGGLGGGGKLVVPRPGQLDVHPVPADSLAARVDGNRIIVTATWTSGVEPCYVLDTILVEKGVGTYTITLREGHGPGDVVCIEIAEQHRTEFEIPDVPSGTWTIQDAAGRATPVDVTVP
jgi:hypothetical protein